MLEMSYVGTTIKYNVNFKRISDHIIQLTGDFPKMNEGIILSRIGKNDRWDYTGYKTVYKDVEGGVQFSDDGSVYTEQANPDLQPEPELYTPSLDEVKASKKQEIYSMYQSVTAAGMDVELSDGVQHFPLSEEDRSFLMGKQIELNSGAAKVSYQDSNNHCMMLSRDDMQAIITAALTFVNAQTTYRNNLCEWVDKCETSEEVDVIAYGIEIPTEHQNEVYKGYMAQQKEG